MIRLTKREIEVRDLICKGWENREIATRLRISHRTVEDFRVNVFKKYAVRNAVELVRVVYELGEPA